MRVSRRPTWRGDEIRAGVKERAELTPHRACLRRRRVGAIALKPPPPTDPFRPRGPSPWPRRGEEGGRGKGTGGERGGGDALLYTRRRALEGCRDGASPGFSIGTRERSARRVRGRKASLGHDRRRLAGRGTRARNPSLVGESSRGAWSGSSRRPPAPANRRPSSRTPFWTRSKQDPLTPRGLVHVFAR